MEATGGGLCRIVGNCCGCVGVCVGAGGWGWAWACRRAEECGGWGGGVKCVL